MDVRDEWLKLPYAANFDISSPLPQVDRDHLGRILDDMIPMLSEFDPYAPWPSQPASQIAAAINAIAPGKATGNPGDDAKLLRDLVTSAVILSVATNVAGQTTPAAPPEQGEGKGGADSKTVSTPTDSTLQRADWITVSEAERISGINRGVISRAVDQNEIGNKGKEGRERRLDPSSFSQWVLNRSPGADSTPDPKTIIERAKAERQKRGVSDDD